MEKNKRIVCSVLVLMMATSSWALAQKTSPSAQRKSHVKAVAPLPKKTVVSDSKPIKEVAPAVLVEKSFVGNAELIRLIEEDNDSSEVVLDAAWGDRNPFDSKVINTLPDKVLVERKVDIDNKKFILSGILWKGGQPNAIINGQVVGAGSVVMGLTVQEIKENTVVLADGTRKLVLTLNK
ncbi:MAG: hypothetical protein HQL21_02920 [Candidatus Omnitrophica bacterium]|nr:hypothetical protein [Candidatus Omnitrophota bacterium]